MLKPAHTYTAILLRCLLILSGVMLCLIFSESTSNTGLHTYQLTHNGFDTGWVDLAEAEGSSKNSEPSDTFFNHELKEAPKQQQTISAPHSYSVLKQGNPTPKTDSRDLSPDKSLITIVQNLVPKEVRSSIVFRLTIPLFSHFLSLPGDIAINAP